MSGCAGVKPSAEYCRLAAVLGTPQPARAANATRQAARIINEFSGRTIALPAVHQVNGIYTDILPFGQIERQRDTKKCLTNNTFFVAKRSLSCLNNVGYLP
jgi:hypothetical protein